MATKREIASTVLANEKEYTAQILMDALTLGTKEIKEAFLFSEEQLYKFNKYAEQFGVNRKAYKVDEGMWGIKIEK